MELTPVTVAVQDSKAFRIAGPSLESWALFTPCIVVSSAINDTWAKVTMAGSITVAQTDQVVAGDGAPSDDPGGTKIMLAIIAVPHAAPMACAARAARGVADTASNCAINNALLNVKVTLPVIPVRPALFEQQLSTASAIAFVHCGVLSGLIFAMADFQAPSGSIGIINSLPQF